MGTSLWLESLLWASECYNRAATSVNDEWLSPHEVFYGRPAVATAALPPSRPSPCTVTAEDGSPGPYALFFYFMGIIVGGIATGFWMRRRRGSLIRATSGTTRRHRGSPRSGTRQQNRRGISTSPCRSLCPSPRHLLHRRHFASSCTGRD